MFDCALSAYFSVLNCNSVIAIFQIVYGFACSCFGLVADLVRIVEGGSVDVAWFDTLMDSLSPVCARLWCLVVSQTAVNQTNFAP